VTTSNVEIKTSIPAPGTEITLSTLGHYESRSMHGQLPIVWAKAKDSSVWDIADNKYIDFTSTIFVANVGHSNTKVLEALRKQFDDGLIASYSYPTEVRARYLEKLVKFAGHDFEKAFLLSAGTEAMDAVVKLIKMHGQKIGKRRSGIVSFSGNWHGRTMGAQLLSTNYSQKEWIGFHDSDIQYMSFPFPWLVGEESGKAFFESELARLQNLGIDFSKDVAGFVLETFQGWGALFYPKSFVSALFDFAKANGILVAFDEMQSGFSRTGKNFGFEHYQVKPDLIACGKGMGGGFPVSGVIGKAEIMDLPSVGNMSSTHSAGPLACAAGLAVLEEIEERRLTERSAELGQLLHSRLMAMQRRYSRNIRSIQGKGLIAAIIFQGEDASSLATRICHKALSMGLILVHTGRESIKVGPPLTISESSLREGLEILEDAIKTCLN
jgi:4-aminobutyrate aminotransferase-like enzyme